MLTGLANFDLVAFELSLVLDHHPGGFGYLRFSGFSEVSGFLCEPVVEGSRFPLADVAGLLSPVPDVAVRTQRVIVEVVECRAL